MTSNELKHQANLQKWAAAIQECRSSGLSVKQWCQDYGITATTYYRWERELLGIYGFGKSLFFGHLEVTASKKTGFGIFLLL